MYNLPQMCNNIRVFIGFESAMSSCEGVDGLKFRKLIYIYRAAETRDKLQRNYSKFRNSYSGIGKTGNYEFRGIYQILDCREAFHYRQPV